MPRLKVAEKQKKVAPVVIRQAVEAAEQQVGQDQVRVMRPTGPARESLAPMIVEPVTTEPNKEKLEMLRFMDEDVRVYIHPTDNPNEVQFPEVWNGGRKETFQRGVEKVTKRKFVEVLARMKKTSYGNQKVKDAEGYDTYVYPSRTGLVYPFVVIGDSDRGNAWLQKVLAEG